VSDPAKIHYSVQVRPAIGRPGQVFVEVFLVDAEDEFRRPDLVLADILYERQANALQAAIALGLSSPILACGHIAFGACRCDRKPRFTWE
jgi:hypothetical protein